MSHAVEPDLLFSPATELAERVRSGELSARELTETALAQIEEHGARLGAFVDVDAEGALAAADGIRPGDERPFAGVPIAIKNNRPVAGQRMTMCAELWADFTPDTDAHMVRRLREAGCVIVGTTTLPEYGILPVTEPRRNGPARNPWDLERTPGGSSGGSAAAVAAGLLPAAHGNDGGGSIRIPAACCGLVGLKAQRGRVSQGPEVGDSVLVTDMMLTRTVADCAAFLDVMAGYEPGDATWAPPPAEPFAVAARRDPGRLRVALTCEPPLPDITADPAHAEAVRETGRLLESLGHSVEEATPPWTSGGLMGMFSAVFMTAIDVGITAGGLIAGREPEANAMEPLSAAIHAQCAQITSTQYTLALLQLQALSRVVVGFFSDYDVLVTPSLAARPVRLGEIDACGADPMGEFAKSARFVPYTGVFNVTGQPAISLPLYHGEDGLPIGVQIAARPAEEGLLLALAAQLEDARPWADRRPPALT